MKIIIACLVALLLCSCQQVSNDPPSERPQDTVERQKEVRDVISRYFDHGIGILRGPLTVREVGEELDDLGRQRSDGNDRMIFGGPDWDRLKAKLQRGDELYYYKSDHRSWAQLHGWEGYVAIRASTVIGVVLVASN